MSKLFKILTVVVILSFSAITIAQVVDFFKGGRTSSVVWTAPTLNEDGSTLDDLAGYVVGIFDKSTDVTVPDPTSLYVASVDASTEQVSLLSVLTDSGLPTDIYLFAVKAVDDHGNESDWSDFISVDIKVVRPNPPTTPTLNQ